MNYDEWYQEGVERGYCTHVVCLSHDWVPMLDEEQDMEMDDLCISVVRLGSPKDWQRDLPER